MLNDALREAGVLLRETYAAWREDDARTWGAALAYYAILSLPPLVLVLLSLVGAIHGEAISHGELMQWTNRFLGPQGTATVRSVVETAPPASSLVGAGGVIFLLALGSRVFAHLHEAMNFVWGVEWPGGGVVAFLRSRVLGLCVVLALGALLVLVIGVSAALSLLAPYAERIVPGTSVALVVGNVCFTFVVVTLIFATFFRVLPDVRLSWRDVWVGAAISAALFLIGNSVLAAYLGISRVASAYGAAGSLLGLLMWFYYSAQVYFFGAEFAQVWARRHGSSIEPARGAVLRRSQEGP